MRITPVTPGTRPELAAIEAGITAERGRVSLLYQVLLNSPPLAQGWEQLLTAVRNRSSVPALLREMVILRVAVLNRAPMNLKPTCRMRWRPACRRKKSRRCAIPKRARKPHVFGAGTPRHRADRCDDA
jgi:hypothetical protein